MSGVGVEVARAGTPVEGVDESVGFAADCIIAAMEGSEYVACGRYVDEDFWVTGGSFGAKEVIEGPLRSESITDIDPISTERRAAVGVIKAADGP